MEVRVRVPMKASFNDAVGSALKKMTTKDGCARRAGFFNFVNEGMATDVKCKCGKHETTRLVLEFHEPTDVSLIMEKK